MKPQTFVSTLVSVIKRLDNGLGGFLEFSGERLLFGALGVTTLFCLVIQILSITHPFPIDYGEAPLVDQAMRLASGANIYRTDISTPPYTISNYPPLFIAVILPFVELFGPNFWAGRLISTLCALLSAFFVYRIMLRLTRDRFASLAGGLILLANPFVVHWSSLLRIDLLALALSLSGLLVLLPWPLSRLRLLAGAALLVAAIYTRQSYALAAPLAAFCWLLFKNWRRAIALAGIVALMSLVIFFFIDLATLNGFFYNIVTANVNEFGLDRLKWNLLHLWDVMPILLVVSAFCLVLFTRKLGTYSLVTPYLIGGALSALTIGKIGSNVNYFLELSAGLSLAAASVLAWLYRIQPSRFLRAVVLMALAFQSVLMLHNTMTDYLPDLNGRRANISGLRKLEARVAASQGPVLADEYMGMINLAGRSLYIQPFEVTQLSLAGLWDQKPLLNSITKQEFPLILIHFFPNYDVYKERWTPEMLSAIHSAYTPVEEYADTRVYVPKQATVVEAVAQCPGAPWRLPTQADLGLQWEKEGLKLDLYGKMPEGADPVYAVADGLLSHPKDTPGMLMIQHDDPLNPGRKVWSVYWNLLKANGVDELISPDFSPGRSAIPVLQGQLLGYQGSYSGRPGFPGWSYVGFGVVDSGADGSYPSQVGLKDWLDPRNYLGVDIPSNDSKQSTQSMECKK
jgi:hypothetical protein